MESKQLGRWAAQALVAGTMLGIGIFIAPPVVAKYVHSPLWFLALWLGGGLAALCGALCMAELGAMMPRAGGEYLYLRASYGPGIAFATGWLQLLAIFPGSLAAMAVGTATFQLPTLFGPGLAASIDLGLFTVEGPTFWAVVLVVLLTALNHLGIVLSGRIQLILTIVPLAVLLLVSLYVIGDVGAEQVSRESLRAGLVQAPGALDLAQAYLPIYFAYSGWNAAIYVGGEISEPGKNLPFAVVGGTLVVLVLYVVLCAGFLSVFDTRALAGVGEAGTAAAGQLFGHVGVIVVTLMILLAMLGSINGSIMTGSRVAYAMAKEGHCPPLAGRLHQRFGTPIFALWAQAALAIGLIASRKFDQLMDYASAAMLISGSLGVAAVVVLRRKQADQPRPYRLRFYPWAPAIYIASSLFVLGSLALGGDLSVWMAFGWFALALLIHAVAVASRRR
jgi:APA family basic amino acid/polyamine antiporter